jgi:hypothetical protein
MRKLILIIAMIVLTGMAGFTQVFEKGSQAINLGMGVGNSAYLGSFYSGFIPSISGSYEYGIVEIPMGSDLTGVVSAGGYLGWSASKYYAYGYTGDKYSFRNDIIIAARGNYHFIFHDKLDTYAGVWVGVDLVTTTYKGPGDDPYGNYASTGPTGGAYAGARWYFTDNFGVYAEVGWLISVFNVGVTLKIR